MSVIKKTLIAVVLLVALAFSSADYGASASLTPVATGKVVIDSGKLNVRATKASNSGIIGAVTKGSNVSILNRDGNTYKIIYNGGVGYVNVNYVQATYHVRQYESFGFINENVNYRQNPETLAKALGIFYKNHKVYITGVIGSWYQVKVNNVYAYVPVKSVGINPIYTKVDNNGTIKTSSKIYKSTNLSGTVLKTVSKGTSIKITGTYGDWYRVNYNNSVGYMLKSNVDIHPTFKNVTPDSFVFVKDKIKLYNAPSKAASYSMHGQFDFDIAGVSKDEKWVVVTDPNKLFSNTNKTYYILKSDIKPQKILGKSKEVKEGFLLTYKHEIYLNSKDTAILRRLYEKELILALTGKAIDTLSDKAYQEAVQKLTQVDLDTIKKLLRNRGLQDVPVIGAFETLISFATSPKEFVEGYLIYPQAVTYYYLLKADKGKGVVLDFSVTGFTKGARSQ